MFNAMTADASAANDVLDGAVPPQSDAKMFDVVFRASYQIARTLA